MKILVTVIAIAIPNACFAGTTVHSQTLFESMKVAGMRPTLKEGKASTYSAYDVICMYKPDEKVQTSCEMYSRKGSHKYSVFGEQARKMNKALQTLDVEKGTSGSATDYISCTFDPELEYMDRDYTCTVAMTIECDEDVCH
jgi:hypothetical protein